MLLDVAPSNDKLLSGSNNILLLKKSLEKCYNNEKSEENHDFDKKPTKMAAILFL